MSFDKRTEVALWGVVVLIGIASVALSVYRFSDLPDLGVTLGPDLTVRSVAKEQASGSEPTFKRGDRLEAIEGQTVDNLQDLRVILKSLPDEKLKDPKGLRYQLVRPRHRFTIALQGDRLDPTALPPGYNPKTDRLVAIDGRPLPDEIGLEGVRSVVASKPDALLTFERRDAVFSGRVTLRETSDTEGSLVIFGFALLGVLLLWRLRSRELPIASGVTIALETVAVGWIALLTVAYQWLMGDFIMVSGVVVSLVVARPLAMFARARAFKRTAGGTGGWALAIGAVSALAVLVMLHRGHLENAEVALFAGASVGGLFLVYEIILVAFDDRPHMTLREGGGYLVGILLVAIATAIFSWNVEPTVFREELWRWFTVAFVALVWFGDVLFSVRGPGRGGYGELISTQERRERLRRYLSAIAGEMPETRPILVVQQGDEAVSVGLGKGEGGLVFETTSEAVRDVISIMVQERARIPLPDNIDRAAHPLSGIAQTMDIVLAMRLQPPAGGMEFPQTRIVLMATEACDAGELPSYASAETIDFAQRKMDASGWMATYVEGTARMPEIGRLAGDEAEQGEAETGGDADEDGEDGEATPSASPEELEAREAEIEKLEAQLEEMRDSVQTLREDRSGLADQLQILQDRWRHVVGPVEEAGDLLEDELIEGLRYLLESPQPVVVGGPFGGGKAFTVRYALQLDGRPPEALAIYDAFLDAADDHHRRLFGHADASDPAEINGFVATARGGALLVRSAERLSDSVILGLCNAADEMEFRLFLAFNESDIEQRSVLEERANAVRDALEHRELIIPPLRRRQGLLPELMDYYLARFAGLRERPVEGFSDRAMAALRAHPYPAEIREAKMLVDLAVLRCDGAVIELEDLPEMVARVAPGTDED